MEYAVELVVRVNLLLNEVIQCLVVHDNATLSEFIKISATVLAD